MANVIVKILGQNDVSQKTASSVGSLKSDLGLENYSASVNGTPQTDDFTLSDNELVTFAQSVKGGNK